jgi:hypothetical protein
MRFLVIVQDLRISGTSQGILERSFLWKLRKSYPDSVIDVVYNKAFTSDDELGLLPVNSIKVNNIEIKVPKIVTWVNKLYWRILHISLKEEYIHEIFRKELKKISFESYDNIFLRSTGIECENLLGALDLPILKKSIIFFNEPYPYFWCSGKIMNLSSLQLFKLKKIVKVVEQAKSIVSTKFLARDLQFLYGTKKHFNVLSHHFSEKVFNLEESEPMFNKSKKVTISYHGAIQFGRNLEEFLDIYCELINKNELFKNETEFFTRLKSSEYYRLKKKYEKISNIHILEGVSFSTSYLEQKVITDINISLENGPIYCSVLLGKAPVLAEIPKRILSLSPIDSEMRYIISNEKYIATYGNHDEIKSRLSNLISEVLTGEPFKNQVFENYFSDENFKKQLDVILQEKEYASNY